VTQLLAIDFTAGPSGAAITTANTPAITTQTGTAKPTFSTTLPAGYTPTTGSFYSAQVDLSTGSSFNIVPFTAQTAGAWFGFYFMQTATSAAAAYWLSWLSSAGTKVGDLRWDTAARTLTLRDSNTSVATSPAVDLNVWHRAAIHCDPGSASGHRLKLYLGANRSGSTADWDSGTQAATAAAQTDVASFRFGLLSGPDVHYRLARLRINTVEASAISAAVAYDSYYASAGIWKPMNVKTTW
jgi:hypothetical protein